MCAMVFVPPLSIEKFRNGGVFATTIAPRKMPVRHLLGNLQWRGAFVAAFASEKRWMKIKKFIPQLAIDTEYLKGFHRMGEGRIFFIKKPPRLSLE
jgi:hypothetical protein